MDVFAAIADPVRRQIVEMLALQGQLSATQIAEPFSITAQAISRHLKVLREAHVIQMDKRAQQRLYRINPANVKEIEAWAQRIGELWEARFDAIATLLEEETRRSEEQEQSSA
jgi:DNA-binding transcriptional ArsR family regulator